MIKRHKTLETLIERAERKDESASGNWAVGFRRVPTGELSPQGKEVIQCDYTVLHYGSLVLHFSELKVSSGQAPSNRGFDQPYEAPVLRSWYGESRSDADALNAVCVHFGMPDRFTFRPVNGGFIKLV